MPPPGLGSTGPDGLRAGGCGPAAPAPPPPPPAVLKGKGTGAGFQLALPPLFP